jgi:hypothetical protein
MTTLTAKSWIAKSWMAKSLITRSLSAAMPIPTANPAPAEVKAEDMVAERRREAAARALGEATARREKAQGSHSAEPGEGERSGRGGLDPVRYGDWEVKGIATDF